MFRISTQATDGRGHSVRIGVFQSDPSSFMVDGPCRLIVTQADHLGENQQILTEAGWKPFDTAVRPDDPPGVEIPAAAAEALEALTTRQARKIEEAEARAEQYRLAAEATTNALLAVTAAAGLTPSDIGLDVPEPEAIAAGAEGLT